MQEMFKCGSSKGVFRRVEERDKISVGLSEGWGFVEVWSFSGGFSMAGVVVSQCVEGADGSGGEEKAVD